MFYFLGRITILESYVKWFKVGAFFDLEYKLDTLKSRVDRQWEDGQTEHVFLTIYRPFRNKSYSSWCIHCQALQLKG